MCVFALTALAAAPGASADALQLGPFTVSDFFYLPTCSPKCNPADFPDDLGVVRTFAFALAPGDVVTDMLIEGVWGGTNPWSAPVEVYLGNVLIATCTAADACITDPTGRLPWNGGAGFRLTDTGANLADFQHDDVTLSLIQTGTANEDSVDLSGLQVTVFIDRTCGPEVCDGFDNDCNGIVDDGIADLVTGTDVGACQTEIQSCIGGTFQVTQAGIAPTAETCNNVDDDCNGTVDDGIADLVSGTDVGACQTEIQSCIGGTFQITQTGIGPAAETCNGLDDDCNGVTDDGIADIVSGTDVGACQTEIQSCVGGTFQITQTAIGPTAETCNDIDDDCNGTVDDGIADLVSGSDVGACQTEIQSCIGGTFQVTQAGIGPTAETCNDIDDDCNGTVDDGIADLVSGTDVGACQTEIQSCVGGSFQVTQAGIGPTAETCNGLDDDCNGTVDDGIADIVTGSDVGACRSEVQSCVGGTFQVTQTGIGPTAETCNDVDDDCNGTVDDGIADIVTGSDVGACQTEIQSCVGGAFQITQTGIGPTAETCNNVDDDCNGAVDDGVADIVTGSDVGECQSEIQSCVDGSFQVTQAAIGPAAETCNGLDDDCNGVTDDGIADLVSGSDVGACQTEIQSCVGGAFQVTQAGIGPTAETCNGLDDDCNGTVDDGIADLVSGSDVGACQTEIQSCIGGTFQVTQAGIAPTAETCNNVDDDCNGTVDDGIADVVSGSDVGECQTQIQSCVGGTFQITQTGIGPSAETCNGLDDDCNGTVDDGIADIVTGSDVGACQTEIQSCVGGSFQITQAAIGPAAETCNGLDDDCNGTVDDGIADLVSGTDVGACQTEVQSCIGGTFQITQAGIGPAAETCNGLDDDCNGVTDDGIADLVSGSDVGQCQSEIQSCVNGSFQVTQTGIGPTAETCNGLDDDCNGTVDDGIADLVSGSDVGACQTEIQSCVGGTFQVTQAGIGPATETCNGLDDDCNGITDDGIDDLVSGSDVGQCQREIQSCVGGTFQVTQTGIGPTAETCNGLDDDCNGTPDNGIADIVTGTDMGQCQTEVQSCVGGSFQVTQTGIGPTAETCNGLDDDCNGTADDGIAPIVTGSDVGECRSEIQSCVGGAFQVTQTAILPSAETCNGLDDDCDSVVDNGIADIVTGTDVGECQTGIQSCIGGSFQVTQVGIPPSQETCNGLDDDCNGQVDDGIAPIVSGSDVGQCQSEIQTCVAGSFQITQAGIGPTTEVCNGLDDDCDTQVDDNIPDIVTNTDTGQCQAEIQSCIDGTFQITQTGIGPAPETCNGLDDDCNGQIDDGIPDRVNGSDVGECQSEIQSCIDGSFQVVRAAVGPTVEVCNGLDDDCDTVVDDNIADVVTGTDVGECQTEIQSCIGGSFQVTQAAIGPAPETCNGLDDDCNGQADDGVADIVTGTDVGECRTEIQSCVGGSFQVKQTGIGPATETCNGLDDDCNGTPDDAIADIVTGTDVGECRTEIQSCVNGSFEVTQTEIAPTKESCNGLDDDCNGQVDDGVADIVTGSDVGECRTEIQHCTGGSFQITQTEITPTAEVCNGLDDDCNSVADDGIADVVTGSDVGECQREIQRCQDGSFAVVQPGIGPVAETCNGLDDDCNAVTDDGITPIVTGSNIGECRPEIQECVGGSFQVTQTGIDPVAETCDGKDENCNSIVDDVANIVTGSDVGACRPEIQTCLGGTYQVTQTEITPTAEACNGLDDDCNGQVDDGVADIVTGTNVGECQQGIQRCIDGSFQVTQVLYGPTSEVCNGLDDDCNGVVDNDFGPVSCGIGVCEVTVQSCVNGVPQQCVPATGPGMELCLDGLDDNCNGTVDDADVCNLPSYDATARDVELSQFDDRNLVLVAAESGGLRLLEFTPLGPHQVGALDPATCKDGFSTVAASVEDVDARPRSDRIYMAAGPCGFWIASIANSIASPDWLSAVDTPGYALDVKATPDDSLLFVADHNGGLELFDVTDPTAPQELGFVGRADASFGAAIDVDYVGGIVFVATTRGLRVVDPSDVQDPVLIGAFDTPDTTGPGQDVEAVERDGRVYAYLSAFQEGVYILDVTDPTQPQLVGRMPSRAPGVAAVYETTVAGSRAFLSEDASELRIYDVSDPSNPLELSPYPARGYIWDVAVGTTGGNAVAYLGYGEDAFGVTPGVDGINVTTMGLRPQDVELVPEPGTPRLVAAALATLLLLRARLRQRRGGRRGAVL